MKPGESIYDAEREHIEGLWACGYTAQEIAEELGWKVSAKDKISDLRRQGFDLPHRRSAQTRDRMSDARVEQLS